MFPYTESLRALITVPAAVAMTGPARGMEVRSWPVCKRRSRHRFVCTTTVRGTAACDRTELACDGPSPWELRYSITVKFRSVRSDRLRVTATEI